MSDVIAVEPANGSVVHGLLLNDYASQQIKANHWMLYGRTLCGIRGQDAWGGGGLRWRLDGNAPLPFSEFENKPTTGWDNRTYNTVCARCTRRANKLSSSPEVDEPTSGGDW